MTTDSSAREYLNGGGLKPTANFNQAFKDSRYKFPLDFQPSIDGLSAGENSVMRRLICIGAEWMQHYPEAAPDSLEFRQFCTRLNPLGGVNEKTFDTLLPILTEVKEKGFEGYVADLRAQKAAAAKAGGMDR